jgi:hypothetical protein
MEVAGWSLLTSDGSIGVALPAVGVMDMLGFKLPLGGPGSGLRFVG